MAPARRQVVVPAKNEKGNDDEGGRGDDELKRLLLKIKEDMVTKKQFSELDLRLERLEETTQRLEETTQRLEETTQRLEETTQRLEETTQRLEETTQLTNEQVGEFTSTLDHLAKLCIRMGMVREFQQDFVQDYLITSISQLVDLVADADTSGNEKTPYQVRQDAANLLVERLNSLRPSFVKAAIRSAIGKAKKDLGENIPKSKAEEMSRPLEPLLDSLGMKETNITHVGETTIEKLGALAKDIEKMSKSGSDPINAEELQAIKANLEDYKMKLYFIRKTCELEFNLYDSDRYAIMFLSAAASAGSDIYQDHTKLEQWIEKDCDILDFDADEEVQCDVKPQVEVLEHRKRAIITMGEIKSSATFLNKAKKQAKRQANLIEFALRLVVEDREKE